MENKVEILREMGHDIIGIIEGCNHPRVLTQYYSLHKNHKIPKWTEESITKFSNTVYRIVTKQEKETNGQKETFPERGL